MKPLLTITEDENGNCDVEVFYQPDYSFDDYAQLAADAIRTISSALGTDVEMFRRLVNLHVTHGPHDLKETHGKPFTEPSD